MKIKIYGADWCSDCVNLKRVLTLKGKSFEYIVITGNAEATDFVIKINNGKKIIPTLDVDGKIYTNPTMHELTKILTE